MPASLPLQIDKITQKFLFEIKSFKFKHTLSFKDKEGAMCAKVFRKCTYSFLFCKDNLLFFCKLQRIAGRGRRPGCISAGDALFLHYGI
jgi:hypothetical protein